jgi:hypothetical protein
MIGNYVLGRELTHPLFHDNNRENNMIKYMVKNGDSTLVDHSIRLRELKRWKINDKQPMPFYLHTGDSGGVVFNGKPEIVRQLMRIYNTQKLFFHIELVSFLNSEGIVACSVSAPVDDVLGYHAELSNN